MIDIERKAPSQQRWWREACSCRHVFPPSESSIHSFSLLSFLFTFPQLPTTHNSLGLFSHFALTHVFTFLSSSEVTSTINGGQDYRATGDPGIFYSNTCHFYCLPASLEKYVNTNNRLFSYTLVFVSSLRTFPFQHNYLHSFRNHSAFLLSPCFVHPPSSASHLYADAKNPGAASTATAVIRRKMDVGEAYQILNLERTVVDKVSIDEVCRMLWFIAWIVCLLSVDTTWYTDTRRLAVGDELRSSSFTALKMDECPTPRTVLSSCCQQRELYLALIVWRSHSWACLCSAHIPDSS